MHHHNTEPYLHHARIIVSRETFAFTPFGSCRYSEFEVPLASIKRVDIQGSPQADLFLHVELEIRSEKSTKGKDVTLNFADSEARATRGQKVVGPLVLDTGIVVSRSDAVRSLETVREILNTALEHTK
jgi:hypothetical protein